MGVGEDVSIGIGVAVGRAEVSVRVLVNVLFQQINFLANCLHANGLVSANELVLTRSKLKIDRIADCAFIIRRSLEIVKSCCRTHYLLQLEYSTHRGRKGMDKFHEPSDVHQDILLGHQGGILHSLESLVVERASRST